LARVAKYGGEKPGTKAEWGQLYFSMRHWAHETHAASTLQQYDIHPSVTWGLDTLIFGEGRIAIGEQTYLGRNCFVVSHPAGKEIRIGKECSISHNVHIRTNRHPREMQDSKMKTSDLSSGSIFIGDFVLIGANAFIRGGVTIGDGSVIGVNSVVTSDVPPHSVYGGGPARPIHRRFLSSIHHP
jgi:maltose O-acetyltransferase